MLLGYRIDARAQQHICPDCMSDMEIEKLPCYICGVEISTKEARTRKPTLGRGKGEGRTVQPSGGAVKDMLGLGRKEFTKEQVESLGGTVN